MTPYLDLSVTHPDLHEDPLLTNDWLRRSATAYAAGTPLDDPEISPAYADLAGLPPTRMISSTYDTLCPDADLFEQRARASGVHVEHEQVQGLWHVFPLQAGLVARADEATAAMGRFLVEHWS